MWQRHRRKAMPRIEDNHVFGQQMKYLLVRLMTGLFLSRADNDKLRLYRGMLRMALPQGGATQKCGSAIAGRRCREKKITAYLASK